MIMCKPLRYHFDYYDCNDEYCGTFEYNYEPTNLEDCINAWYEDGAMEEDRQFMLDNDWNPDDPRDRRDWAFESDDFWDYAYDFYEDEAHEAFLEDDDIADQVAEAEEYRRDPYAYNGVHRSDFF